MTLHALRAMESERPRVRTADIERTLEEPDHDDGKAAFKRIGRRTIILRYAEHAEAIVVITVSATRSRLRP